MKCKEKNCLASLEQFMLLNSLNRIENKKENRLLYYPSLHWHHWEIKKKQYF